jgi:nucleotide-binding universal stress UspA family protein
VYPEQWDWAQARDKTPEDWVARMLQHSATKLIEAGLKVETDFYDGDPKQVLLREADDWKANCIFLGARGLHHGTGLMLGTTASAVATRAHCSVEIVRPH